MGVSVLKFASKVLKQDYNVGTPGLEWVPIALKRDHNLEILVLNGLPRY